MDLGGLTIGILVGLLTGLITRTTAEVQEIMNNLDKFPTQIPLAVFRGA